MWDNSTLFAQFQLLCYNVKTVVERKGERRVGILNPFNPVRQEMDLFAARVLEFCQSTGVGKTTLQEIKEQLADLKQLALLATLEKKRDLAPVLLNKKENLLQKYEAENMVVAQAQIAQKINERNPQFSDNEKWVNLKCCFWHYYAQNQREITNLRELEEAARKLQADLVAEAAQRDWQALLKERQDLREMVNLALPEDYLATAEMVTHRAGLYKQEGRSILLWSYHQQVKNCGGEVVQAIRVIEQGMQEKKQGALGNLCQRAQTIRELPTEKGQIREQNRERV